MGVSNALLTQFDPQLYATDAYNKTKTGSRVLITDPSTAYKQTDFGLGIRVGQGYADIARVHSAILPFSFGDDVMFWRVWFEPVLIDAGFIVEDKEYYVKVWNAHLDVTASITAVSSVSPVGTTITHDPLPITIGKFGDEWITIKVLEEGPPVQNTVYEFTINAVDYETEIDGIRVSPFMWEPNWNKKVNVEMHFDTALDRNKYFVEQRRPLRHKPYYKFSFSVNPSGVDAQKLKQLLAYAHDKVLGLPLFNEQAHPSQSFNGSATIVCSNDLSKFWNLNNQATFVVVVDHQALQAEIKEIESVAAGQIVCTLPVSDTFTWQSSVVYPVVMVIGESFDFRPESDDVINSNLSFSEYERSSAT